jgi:tetratricopeptide (TPR) repeat protein
VDGCVLQLKDLSRSFLRGLLLGVALVAHASASPQEAAGDGAALWRQVESVRSEDANRAWEQILGRADELVLSVLDDFGAQSLAGRRARADLLALHGPVSLLERATDLALDPDTLVRLALLSFLEQPRHRDLSMAPRVEKLGWLAREDPDPKVRIGAIEALGRLDTDLAVSELAALANELPPTAAARAVANLPVSLRSLGVIRSWVVGGFTSDTPGQRTSDPVLAAALPLHGRLIADRPGALLDPEEKATWVRGLRHPNAAVRAAAALAFQNFVGRLRAVGEVSRALEVLQDLEEQGLDTRLTQYHRVRLAFYPAGDASLALQAARAMRAANRRSPDTRPEERLWLSRSLYLEAMAGLASAPDSAARAAVGSLFREAEQVLDALIAERLDRADEGSIAIDANALEFRALVEIAHIVLELENGAKLEDRALVERARRAHTWLLSAQLDFTRIAGDTLLGWDAVLDSELSPFRLIFTNLELPGIDIPTSLARQAQLGILLASVASQEMPGFEPLGGLPEEISNPLADLQRRELLVQIQDARLDWIVEEIRRVTRRMVDAQSRRPWVVHMEATARLEELDMRRRRIARAFMEVDRSGGAELLELRTPASLALWLARDLRNEGRAAEARAVAVRMRDDLERTGISVWWYYFGLERLAQAEMAIGSSYTDEGVPKLAEVELLRAVERLEGIERRMREAGAGIAQLGPLRNARCSALVSLAVNANVKLEQPERALEFFEQAFALRKDDFMRVLLACYRARSGRADEARALLRDIRPYPSMFYNMACTYALMGDSGQALDLLERDFEENHPSESSVERQREWASKDPDLASLRGDPRFQALVRPR